MSCVMKESTDVADAVMPKSLKCALSRAFAAMLQCSVPIRVVMDQDDEDSAPYGIEADNQPSGKPLVCTVHPNGYVG